MRSISALRRWLRDAFWPRRRCEGGGAADEGASADVDGTVARPLPAQTAKRPPDAEPKSGGGAVSFVMRGGGRGDGETMGVDDARDGAA